MSTGSTLSEDAGDLDWDDAKLAMRAVVNELRFYQKKPTKPRAIRIGSVRFIIVGFRDD